MRVFGCGARLDSEADASIAGPQGARHAVRRVRKRALDGMHANDQGHR
jgi:hypothetical protein